jgi:O-antigen ligase
MATELTNPNSMSAALIIAILGLTGFCTYLLIGRDMLPALWGVVAITVFLLCFFSVKISLAVLIFSMLLSPEAMVGSTSAREITIRLEDLLLFVMTLGWLFRIAIFKDIGLMLKTPMNRPIIVYSACMFLSTIYNGLVGNLNLLAGFFFCLKLMEYFIVFYIIVNYVEKPEEINRLLTMMLIVCGIVTLYGAFQVVTGGDVAAPFEGSIGEHNTLGGYLVLMGSIAGGVILHTDSKAEGRVLTVMLCLLIFVLLFSGSRSGWLGACVSLTVVALSARRKRAYFLLVPVFIVLYVFFMPEKVYNRFMYTFSQLSNEGQQVHVMGVRLDTSTSARFFSYKEVIEHIYRHPILGYGMTGFGFLDGQYFRTLVEMGMVGIAAFVWLLSRTHNLIRQCIPNIPPGRLQGMTIGLFAGFWGLLAHALTANTFIIVRICEPFWCLMGLATVSLLAQQPDTDLLGWKRSKAPKKNPGIPWQQGAVVNAKHAS